MIAILLTFEEAPKGIMMNQAVLSPKEGETDLEKLIARTVDCGIKAAQLELTRAVSEFGTNKATIIEGSNVRDHASKLAKEILATDVFAELKKAGFKT